MKKKALIVNKNKTIANDIRVRLSNTNTEVFCATNIDEALQFFIKLEFCLIILDANISAEDNHQLLRAMRKSRTTPILVLSSQVDHTERLRALQAGAHAYMGHPYSLEECLAQAQSLMQMYMEMQKVSDICYTLAFGKDLLIDPSTRQVFLKGKELLLTQKEFDILFCLASNPGQVFSREQLYDRIWDEHAAFNIDDVVKTHIKTLRRKLSEADMEYIKNVWGVGYRFQRGTSDE